MGSKSLNVLMYCHHRRFRAFARPMAMAKHLVERGHSVTLVVIADKRRSGIRESDVDNVRLIETPDLLWGRMRSGWDPWDILQRLIWTRRLNERFDLVHCFETRPATIYPALAYCRRWNVPLLTDWNDWWGHGGVISVNRPWWYRLLFSGIETHYEEDFRNCAAGLTVISHALAERAVNLGVPSEHICHLSGGSFTDLFLNRDRDECRAHVGVAGSDPVLGFTSLDLHWDLDIVMQALAKVAQRYPNVKLMITGNVNKTVLTLAEKFGVADKVWLTGFLPIAELPWYLGCADIFLMPFPENVTNIGRWPNKMGDYLSIGRPTVSNPTGDIRDLYQRHEVGLLSEWNADDFAAKIIYLLENPEIAQRMGATARKVAETEYDWRVLIQRLEEFYWQVLSTNGS